MAHRALIRPIENFEFLDGVADVLSSVVNRAVRPAKSILSGTWLGHPLHPVLTDVVVGAWGAGVTLDLIGGEKAEAAADRLIGLGVLSFFPTAISGWSDWADSFGKDRRVGLVHAVVNGTAMSLFAASWLSRKSGHRRRGRVLALVATAEVSFGGYLGGHLAFGRGMGVDHTAFEHVPEEWTDVGEETAVAEGALVRVEAAGVPVLLCRREGEIQAIGDTCSHAGGPLHEGELDDSGCVSCPWHGSRFRLSDGAAVRGPASTGQPSYDVRVEAGRVQVRVRH